MALPLTSKRGCSTATSDFLVGLGIITFVALRMIWEGLTGSEPGWALSLTGI
jgi:hypothetical protein